MGAKKQSIYVPSCIHEYFGKNAVRAAVLDYMKRNDNTKEAHDMLSIISNKSPDKFIDIICDYLDKNQ